MKYKNLRLCDKKELVYSKKNKKKEIYLKKRKKNEENSFFKNFKKLFVWEWFKNMNYGRNEVDVYNLGTDNTARVEEGSI